MIYVYCPRVSDGARYLTTALNGKRIQVDRGREYAKAMHHLPLSLEDNEVLVVWGQRLPALPNGGRVLNQKAPIGNKFKELQLLAAKGVPCPESQLQRGPAPEWIGRSFHHQSGDDLIQGGHDYYVKLVRDVEWEVRMHVFGGRVFRTGLKIHDPVEHQHHPMFRTWSTGWIVSYSRTKLREAGINTGKYWRTATSAVKALDYDFGAVDLGIRQDGSPVVFEVNSAPGLDGNTITRYAEQIKAYAERV